MNQTTTFDVPQLNGDGLRKSQEISAGFTNLQKSIVAGGIGNTPEMQIINQKLQEAWLLVNNALVTTARRVAA